MNIFEKWCKINLILRILLIGIGLGALLGITFPEATIIGLLGDIFIGILKATAPILVFLLISSSISNAKENTGKKFKTCISLYLISMIVASLVAVTMSFIFPVTMPLTETITTENAPSQMGDILTNLLMSIIVNPINALVEGNYISILFWSIIFGLCLRRVASKESLKFVSDCADAVSLFISKFIQLAPFGIMGIVFKTVSTNGLGVFNMYGQLLFLGISSILIVGFITDPLISGLVLKRNPYPLIITCFRESGITAFFTRSSASNIPINLKLCERLGLDKDFYSISIPLGSTINMEGAAIAIAVLTLSLCHTINIEVTFLSALGLCIITTIAACGVAAVPNGAVLLVPLAASFFGIPVEISMQAVGVGLITSVIQDSFDTALNSTGDAIFTATTEYYYRIKEGVEVNFLGEFAKK